MSLKKTTTEAEEKSAVSIAFPQFILLTQLGQYAWDPGHNSNEQLKSHIDVTVADILTHLIPDTERSVDALETLFERLNIGKGEKKVASLNLSRIHLPINLRKNLPAQEYPNRFPNDAGYIVPLFVALQRGMILEEVDFVFGGSSLEFLAQRKNPEGSAVYLTQRVQNVILLVKNDSYIQNYADIGFQFERLVTGANIEDKHDIIKHENLRVMQIGSFKILFSAEVDAIDEYGQCVEIKSGNPRYFGTKVMFQMISSGSNTLVQADKRGTTVVNIQTKSINTVIGEHSQSLRNRLQESIIRGLGELQSLSHQVLEDIPSEVGFSGAAVMTLRQRSDLSVLPSKHVVHELFEIAQRSSFKSGTTIKASPHEDLVNKKV